MKSHGDFICVLEETWALMSITHEHVGREGGDSGWARRGAGLSAHAIASLLYQCSRQCQASQKVKGRVDGRMVQS